MITKIGAFKTSNDKTFDTIEAAQQEELAIILTHGDGDPSEVTRGLCEKLVTAADKVVDILTTTIRSKPRARKVNGGTRKRRTTPDPAAVNRALQDGEQ